MCFTLQVALHMVVIAGSFRALPAAASSWYFVQSGGGALEAASNREPQLFAWVVCSKLQVAFQVVLTARSFRALPAAANGSCVLGSGGGAFC